MARNGSRCFSMQTPSNETNTNPTDVCAEENPYNEDAKGAEYTGFIFLCDESTKMDCFKYRVLGLSEGKKIIMRVVTEGMCLFLFDINQRLLYGIYRASSSRAFQLEPEAFGGNSPWQVKFRIEKDCLPLSENVFKAAIKDNYTDSRRFKTRLTAQQVRKLASLFSPLPGGPVQHPTPCTNATSFVEMGRCIQDIHTQRYLPPKPTHEADKADGFIQSDTLSRLNHEPTHPLNDAGNTERCMHGYHTPKFKHVLSLLPACESKLTDGYIQSDRLRTSDHKPTHRHDDAVMTRKCMHGYHAPNVKHGFLPPTSKCEASKAEPIQDAVMIKTCMHGYHAPNAKNGFLPPTSTCEANKADRINQNGPLSRLNHERMHPLNATVMSEKCKHGYSAARANHCFLPPTPATEATLTQLGIQRGPLPTTDHMRTHLLDDDVFVTEKCMHGYHAPRAKHGFPPPMPTCESNKADVLNQSGPCPWISQEPMPSLSNIVMADKCMHGCRVPTVTYGQICVVDDPPSLAQQHKPEHDAYLSHVKGRSISTGHNHPNPSCGPWCTTCSVSELQRNEPNRSRTRADLYPGHTCNSAAHMDSSVHLTPNAIQGAIQGNFLDRKLHEGEPLIDSSSLCQHAGILARSLQNVGILNAWPKHHCIAIAQKRSLQDTSAHALGTSVSNTSGERPLKCMYHQVHERPLHDDTVGGALDAVMPNGYNPWL